jgi:hypothetical protein
VEQGLQAKGLVKKETPKENQAREIPLSQSLFLVGVNYWSFQIIPFLFFSFAFPSPCLISHNARHM